MTPFVFPVRVYYEDTDLAGVVYYANYLKFYERGRTEMVRAIGLDQAMLIEQGLAFAVARAEVDYLKSARFNDALDVVTEVERFGRASVTFKQQIRLSNDPETILSRAIIKVACVTVNDMKPAALPELLVKEWQA
ncbi:tol-pal system-associated acyl-CoA thioesterase [Permianibacter aggregans]|uniref:Acyl-CoA thioester hydrolase n=1 Tax=Permianibacter aggregans TaxID=1510150 RepID=A0A4V3D7J9_9GAMM|nr:tol-pal system-associated acyl-CoA thioesterase [Permianibacter aggregans]TDQ48147.1 acyl-CoA thioester hydrolase [Permianibacter aggregans]